MRKKVVLIVKLPDYFYYSRRRADYKWVYYFEVGDKFPYQEEQGEDTYPQSQSHSFTETNFFQKFFVFGGHFLSSSNFHTFSKYCEKSAHSLRRRGERLLSSVTSISATTVAGRADSTTILSQSDIHSLMSCETKRAVFFSCLIIS